MHEVDGHDLPSHDSLSKYYCEEGCDGYFDRIVWNFPCIGIAEGKDGQANEMEENKTMLQSFFQTCGNLLKNESGEIHISHKTVEPFSW